MSDDDVYVNAGDSYDAPGAYYPDAPEGQSERINEAKAIKSASYPVLPKLAQWFDDQVKSCDNLNNIQVDALTVNGVKYQRTVSVEAQVLAYRLLRDLLSTKAHEFKQFAEAEDV